jgi:hypothetical protein
MRPADEHVFLSKTFASVIYSQALIASGCFCQGSSRCI